MSSEQIPLFEPVAWTMTPADDLRNPEWLAGIKNKKSIGNKRTILLVEYFKSAQRLISASPEEIATVIGLRGMVFADLEPMPVTDHSEMTMMTFYDPDYPHGLRDLDDPPVFLWYRGSIPKQKAIAIVGTRNFDEWGRTTTRKLAKRVGEAGFVVVSGLALGVDTEAHKGCLDSGTPTVAILACDVRFPSPKANRDLAEQIINSGGCLIAEAVPGSQTENNALVARNRLQAAWAPSLLVTQCGIPSGTLHTVRFALELHRPVAVLRPPANSNNEQYAGNICLTEEYKFDSAVLGGPRKFQDKFKGRITGADIVINSQSDFEKYLASV